MSRRKGRVICVGTCKAGHVTRATSAEARTTWNGTCAHEGCELQVFARRAPDQAAHTVTPEAVETGPAAAGAPGHQGEPNGKANGKPGSPARVVKVEGWASERDEPTAATGRAAGRARAKTGVADPAAGGGAKPPGRGKRTRGNERTDPAAGAGGAPGRAAASGRPGAGGGQAEHPEGQRREGRGRQALARVGAAFRGAADDDVGDLFDDIY